MTNLTMKYLFYVVFISGFAFADSGPLKCVRNTKSLNELGTWRLTDNAGRTRMETNLSSKKECEAYTQFNDDYFCTSVLLYRGYAPVIARLSDNTVVGSVPYTSKDSKETCKDYLAKQKIVDKKICVADVHDWKVMDLESGLVFEMPFQSLQSCASAMEQNKAQILNAPKRPMYLYNDLFGRPVMRTLTALQGTRFESSYSLVVEDEKGLDVYVGVTNGCMIDVNLSYWCPNKKVNVPKGTLIRANGVVQKIDVERFGAWFIAPPIKFEFLTFERGEVGHDGLTYFSGFIPYRPR